MTAAVNAAIQTFAQLLPLQDHASMTKTVAQLIESTASAKTERNSGRKAAVLVNSAVALVFALRRASTQSRQVAETIGHPSVSLPLADLLKVYIPPSSVLAGADGCFCRLYSSMEIYFCAGQVVKLWAD